MIPEGQLSGYWESRDIEWVKRVSMSMAALGLTSWNNPKFPHDPLQLLASK